MSGRTKRLQHLIVIHRVVQIFLLGLLLYMAYHFQQLFLAKGMPQVFRNSIIAGNGLNKNCDLQYFTVTYEGKNLSDDSSCGGPSEMVIGNTGLAPLADNGGPGPTHALLAGSLAIDAGTNCTVTTDGRFRIARTASICALGGSATT